LIMDNSPEQRTPEWFAQRKGRVTGSAVGAILGVNTYMTRWDVMRRMVREALGAPSEFAGNVATEWGTNNEAGALVEFQMESGLSVTPAPFVMYEDWLGASPDGYVSDGGLVEIKCPYGIRKASPVPFKTPQSQPSYMAQMYVQMFVTNTEHCHFFQWTPNGTRYDVIHQNMDWIATNIPRLKQFHAEYLDELKNNANEHLGPKQPEIDTPQARAVMEEYQAVIADIERATNRKKDLLEQLVNMTSGNKSVTIAGHKLTKTERQGAISYATAIKKLLPGADLEPYRGKGTSYWQVT